MVWSILTGMIKVKKYAIPQCNVRRWTKKWNSGCTLFDSNHHQVTIFCKDKAHYIYYCITRISVLGKRTLMSSHNVPLGDHHHGRYGKFAAVPRSSSCYCQTSCCSLDIGEHFCQFYCRNIKWESQLTRREHLHVCYSLVCNTALHKFKIWLILLFHDSV